MQSFPAYRGDGSPEPASVAAALEALRRGDLVILPTDTVYGLAADSANPEAIARLFIAKGRPPDKAIALLAADVAQAAEVADLALARGLIQRWWPGPLTVVARATVSLPEGVCSNGSVGLRVPAAAVVQALTSAIGRPLAVTSANRSGAAAVSSFVAAVRDLQDWVAVALDGGDCPLGVASTVVDCTGERPLVLRQGSVRLGDDGGA